MCTKAARSGSNFCRGHGVEERQVYANLSRAEKSRKLQQVARVALNAKRLLFTTIPYVKKQIAQIDSRLPNMFGSEAKLMTATLSESVPSPVVSTSDIAVVKSEETGVGFCPDTSSVLPTRDLPDVSKDSVNLEKTDVKGVMFRPEFLSKS